MAKLTFEEISAYVDGDLPPEARGRVELILREDADSAALADEVRLLKELAADTPLEGPRRDLWPAIHHEATRPRGLRAWLGRGWAGWVAAGALACALVVLWTQSTPPSVTTIAGEPAVVAEARTTYADAIAALEARAHEVTPQLPEETRQVLRRTLAQVDEAIAATELALIEVPQDARGHRTLLALYDEKMRVLQLTLDVCAL